MTPVKVLKFSKPLHSGTKEGTLVPSVSSVSSVSLICDMRKFAASITYIYLYFTDIYRDLSLGHP